MDVLSEVLRAVKLEGGLFFNGEFSAPWCLSEPQSTAIASYLSPEARHLIVYHFLTEGHAYAKLPDGRREELSAGDVVVFPHGDPHFLGSGAHAKPVDALKAFEKNLSEGLKLARHGGGGEITRFVCGFLTCEPELSEIVLSGLPEMLKVQVTRSRDPPVNGG
jgi:Cupin